MEKHKSYSIIGMVLSVIGLILSAILIREYFDSGSAIASALCSASGGASSCETVAKSSYSAIRNLPFFGDLPVALLGFVYYGVVLYVFYNIYSSKKENVVFHQYTALALALFGILIDVVLASISIFALKTVCTLCAFTYLVTLSSFIIIFLQLKNDTTIKGPIMANLGNYLPSGIKLNWYGSMIAILVSFGCGVFISRTSKPSVTPNTNPAVVDSKSTKTASSNSQVNSEFLKLINEWEKKPTVNIDLEGVPFIGDPKAPITIVKYADYNCGHCMNASHVLKLMLTEFNGLIKVYYKDYPLDGACNRFVERRHPQASSCMATSGAYCAYKQGKFQQFYTALYRNTEEGVTHNSNTVLGQARSLGLDVGQFTSCMSSPDTQTYISKEVEEAEKLGIDSTPSVFVNNKALTPGNPGIEFTRALIKHITK